MLDQMRRGLDRLRDIDGDTGVVTRGGGGINAGHSVHCRVSYQSGGVWNYAGADEGANITTTPYVLAAETADIKEGNLLKWRDRAFQVGAVSYPSLGGGAVCLQARLKEVGNDS